MTPTFHTLTVKEVRQETEDTVSIAFDIPEELMESYQYKSGQYLTLRTEIDGEDIRRSYSLCSAPHENEWRVAVKLVPGGQFSTFANEVLKAGDKLDVMTPMGNFTIDSDKSHKRSIVLFAAGSGITPIISIAKTILTQEPQSDVTLFYGNKSISTIIFHEEVEGLKNEYMNRLRFINILSRENLGTPLLKGRMDVEKTNQLFKVFLETSTPDAVYICGPEQMILDVKESVLANGIDPSAVHFELFTTPNSAKGAPVEKYEGPQIDANVSIILDGDRFDIALESDGESILDAASKTGADLPYACKGGVCCTCKAKVLEGEARMDVNYALEPEEVEAGYILTCQAHPMSDQLVVSFDD
ncbi:MAG: phenylacetate-CoA oxygenase/reductase subunit PaaK [Flavobacteriales bacterium]|nr:phenylacetate-CoA oxygenase/reductase subunit PaaK [Flavobacteriales bacterium]PIE87392.1 MAG: phenylacetic acid degradation protein [Bacteroidota bacterium]